MSGNNAISEPVLIHHKRWLTLYQLVMRSILLFFLGVLVLMTLLDGELPIVWIIIMVLLMGRIQQGWWRWKGRAPALKLYSDGIELPVFQYQIGRLSWLEIAEVQLSKKWGWSKQIKLILQDADAVVAREPRRLWRWSMRWKLRIQGTPFVWSSSLLEGSHKEQYNALLDYHRGVPQFSSLSNHLIDDAL